MGELIFTLLQSAVVGAFMAGGVYTAIRADIRRAHEKADAAQHTGDEAHKRIDAILMQR